MEETNGLINFAIKMMAIVTLAFAATAYAAHKFGNEKLKKKAIRTAASTLVTVIGLFALKGMAIKMHESTVGMLEKRAAKEERLDTRKPLQKNEAKPPQRAKPSQREETQRERHERIENQIKESKKEEPKKDYVIYHREDQKGKNRILIKESKE